MSEERCRSVSDFQSEDSLRKALLTADGVDPCGSSSNLDWVIPNLDLGTCEVQSMKEEISRLLALKSYMILDDEREEAFERLTALGSRIFDAPICLVSLVDLGRQWFMSNRGLPADARETPRHIAFCAHAIQQRDSKPFVVPVATEDPRFENNPLVTGPPHLRFYAGAVLISPEGYKLGTFCVIDTKPRPQGITDAECDTLNDLAAMVVKVMVDRRNLLETREDPARLIAYTAHDLMTPLTGVQLSLSLLSEDEDVAQKLNEYQVELLSTASSCSDLMIRICEMAIGSLRQCNRPQHPQEILKEDESQDPVTKLADLVRSLQMIMEPIPKKVPLIFSLDPTVPPTILSDDLKLFRSALNLVSSACGRTARGMVHFKVYTRQTPKRRELVFECEDTGDDIKVEEYQYLFQQAAATEESNLHLGLSSVASLVSTLDGEYGFRPRSTAEDGTELYDDNTGALRHGSVFWFSIPLMYVGNDEAEAEPLEGNMPKTSFSKLPRKTAKIPAVPFLRRPSGSTTQRSPRRRSLSLRKRQLQVTCNLKEEVGCNPKQEVGNDQKKGPVSAGPRQKRALVIEDSLVVRKSLARALSKLGFDVEQAVNGLEGLVLLKEKMFDMTFCDFLMPVMDGLDCVKQYREWEKENRPSFRQRIIGISAHVSVEESGQGLAAGMDDFRPKPISIKTLTDLQSCEAATANSRAIDEIEGFVPRRGDCTELLAVGDADAAMQAAASLLLKKDQDVNEVSERSTEAPTTDHAQDSQSDSHQIPVALIAMDTPTLKSNEFVKVLESNGWKVVVVNDGNDALRLLQMRNWDVALIDDDIPDLSATQCLDEFREWEANSRVNEQQNVFFVCDGDVPSPFDHFSVVQPPSGFNGVLRKPVVWDELSFLLKQRSSDLNIVVRK